MRQIGHASRRLWLTVAGMLAGVSGVCAFPSESPGKPSETRWVTPEALAPTSHRVLGAAVAAGPGRYAVAAWIRGENRGGPAPDSASLTDLDAVDAAPARNGQFRGPMHVLTSVRELGDRGFGEPEVLTPRDMRAFDLGMSADGDTVLIFVDSQGWIGARFRTPESDWSEPQTFGRTDGSAAGLSVAFDGTAIAVWGQGEDPRALKASTRDPGGQFGEPQTVTTGDLGRHGSLAAGSGGRAIVTWGQRCPLANPDERRDLRASVLQPDGTFGEPEVIPGSRCSSSTSRLAIDDSGEAVLLVNGSLDPWNGIEAAVRPPGGPFGPAELISGTEGLSDFAELGLSGDGRAVSVWSTWKRRGERMMRGAKRPTGGEFGSPRGLRNVGQWDLAMSRDGHAASLGVRPAPGNAFRFLATYMRPGGWFGRLESVSHQFNDQNVPVGHIAVNPAGTALAAFTEPPPRHRTGETGGRGVFVAQRKSGPLCRGRRASLVGDAGTADVLRGGSDRDVILGRRGDDRIHGEGGGDWICAGPGDDVIRAGHGDDRIWAGRGDTRVLPGPGTNAVFTGPGNDQVIAREPGRNRIYAPSGRKRIRCGPGRDVVITNTRSWVHRSCNRVTRR